MKKESLSIAQKHRIWDERSRRDRNGTPASLAALAQWAKNEFGFSSKPNRSTILRTLKTRPPLLHTTSNKYLMRRGKDDALESALFEWVCHCRNKRIHITSEIIRSKAFRLTELRNQALSADRQSKMRFSDGWIVAFTKRWGLKHFKSHGESGDYDDDAVKNAMPRIRNRLRQFQHKDLFNADEFGLCYRKARTVTFAPSPIPGRKVEKERKSVLACAYADGSEKIYLMIIGTALCPRPFKKKSGADL